MIFSQRDEDLCGDDRTVNVVVPSVPTVEAVGRALVLIIVVEDGQELIDGLLDDGEEELSAWVEGRGWARWFTCGGRLGGTRR